MLPCEEFSDHNVTDDYRFVKRTTVVARLFYHTANCLLAQTNPLIPPSSPEMAEMQMFHSHQLCGIVAHVKDRSVWFV